MKTDLCTEDMVVRLTTPQMIAAETAAAGAGGAGAGRGAGAPECGRRLLLAARAGDTATVRLLMAKGAPFSTDWLGTSPLHLASANDHVETVGVLLRAGVSRDARTKVERTPLHVAAYAGHARVVRALLDAGAAVDARDLLRMTPLHWAVERRHAAAARLLLRHGASPHAVSKFRKTPLSLAAGDPELRRLLDEAIKEREASRSVDAIVSERAAEESGGADEPRAAVRVQGEGGAARPAAHSGDDAVQLKEIYFPPITDGRAIKSKVDRSPKEKRGDRKDESAAGAAAEGCGAALLRRHGITLLPTDDGSTVLSALQSGRTVVLSDAGKLMLKESGGGGGGEGVVVRATAAARGAGAGPAGGAGGAVFALSPGAKLLRLPRAEPAPPAPAPRPAADPVKLVQMAGAGAEARPAVRIVMNRKNYRKLLLTATRASMAEGVVEEVEEAEGAEGDCVVVVPEQFVRSSSAQYLRSQLLCAHAAIQQLARQLRARSRPQPPS